jgi:P27 family predicted phage terminase small subunit
VAQRAIWTSTVRELGAAGLNVHAIDETVLTAFTTATDQMMAAAEIITRDGVVITGARTGMVRHPATIVYAQSARLVDRLAASLGLAPDSRMRMRLPVPDTEAAHMADPYGA